MATRASLVIMVLLMLVPAWTKAETEVIETPVNTVVPSAANDLRASIVSALEPTLKRVCGGDCPGFSVVVNTSAAKTTKSMEDDLGFSTEKVINDGTPRSVSIEVLVSKQFSAEQQEMVRLAMSAEAKNRTELPVSVRTKPVDAQAQASEALTRQDWFSLARTGIWPFALLALATLTFFALVYIIRDRRKAMQVVDTKIEPVSEPIDSMKAEHAAYLQAIIKDRSQDLAWLIENCSEKNDLTSIKRLIRLFPGDTLTRELSLQPETAGIFARAIVADSNGQAVDSALIIWLKNELDRAHWMRLAEKAGPLMRLSHLNQRQLNAVFQQVSTPKEKAAILMNTSEQHWPKLVSSLPAQDKLGVGSELARVQAEGGVFSGEVQKNVLEAIQKSKKISRLEGIVDDYLYHLSDEEAGALSNRLAAESYVARPRRSVDEVVQNLSESELVELIMQLEIEEIRSLFKHLSADSLKKLNSALPSKLKDRVGPTAGKSTTEAAWIQTRMKWIKLYEKQYLKEVL